MTILTFYSLLICVWDLICCSSIFVILTNVFVQKHGWTALQFAVSEGYEDVVQVLLNAGANVNEKDQVLAISNDQS